MVMAVETVGVDSTAGKKEDSSLGTDADDEEDVSREPKTEMWKTNLKMMAEMKSERGDTHGGRGYSLGQLRDHR